MSRSFDFVPADPRVLNRFWTKVDRSDAEGCWRWGAMVTPDGYGEFKLLRKQRILAHRFAWSQHHQQDIPDGMVIRHSCDTPLCVRPTHLLLGTHAMNVQDRVERGRTARGVANGRAKLDEEAVRAIRRLFGIRALRLIAQEFGVDPKIIRNIQNGVTWSHVPHADLGPVPEEFAKSF